MIKQFKDLVCGDKLKSTKFGLYTILDAGTPSKNGKVILYRTNSPSGFVVAGGNLEVVTYA